MRKRGNSTGRLGSLHPVPQLEQFLLYWVLRKREFEDRKREGRGGRKTEKEAQRQKGNKKHE